MFLFSTHILILLFQLYIFLASMPWLFLPLSLLSLLFVTNIFLYLFENTSSAYSAWPSLLPALSRFSTLLSSLCWSGTTPASQDVLWTHSPLTEIGMRRKTNNSLFPIPLPRQLCLTRTHRDSPCASEQGPGLFKMVMGCRAGNDLRRPTSLPAHALRSSSLNDIFDPLAISLSPRPGCVPCCSFQSLAILMQKKAVYVKWKSGLAPSESASLFSSATLSLPTQEPTLFNLPWGFPMDASSLLRSITLTISLCGVSGLGDGETASNP